MNNSNQIEIIEEKDIKNKVYTIRGKQVMLYFDLAEIYGYTTKRFNEQIKNNIDKFDEDFRFQLSKPELDSLVRSKFSTARIWIIGNSGGRTTLPYAFTEEGIYMIMTVLRGPLAVNQSRKLIKTFKQMKDYIVDTNHLSTTSGIIELTNQVRRNTTEINQIKGQLEIVMDNFIDPTKYKDILILKGERIEADIAYHDIFMSAKQSLYIIDNYLNIKILGLLKAVKDDIEIIIVTDNLAKDKLTVNDINDYFKDTNKKLTLIKNKERFHDRYIIVDYLKKNETIYHSGNSIKDSGNRISTIDVINNKELYKNLIHEVISDKDTLFSDNGE